jgi:translation initiation factor 2B subunit (eIF-2B alpha/beta/delta family)
MKNGKVISRLTTNPRVADLQVTDAGVVVSLKSGFINNGQTSATVPNAHAARLFIRDAIGPDGLTARPGRPAKPENAARTVELPAGFVTRAGDANIGRVLKSNAKKATVLANAAQRRTIAKLANTEANGTNIGLKGSAKAVLAALEAANA